MDIIATTEILARSSTTTSVGWIGYIVIGAIAGWLAGKIVKGGGSGLLMNIVIGIVGALVGGFLLSFFLDTAGGGWWGTSRKAPRSLAASPTTEGRPPPVPWTSA